MYHHRLLYCRMVAALDARPGLSLTALATLHRIHLHTAAAIFRACAGESFSTWLARRRLAAALDLLASRPDLSVKEVAAAVGFGSSSAFDRFMRRAAGCTPTSVRAVPGLPLAPINDLADGSTIGGVAAAGPGARLDPSPPAPGAASRSPDAAAGGEWWQGREAADARPRESQVPGITKEGTPRVRWSRARGVRRVTMRGMKGSLCGAAPLGAVVALVVWTATAAAGASGPSGGGRVEAGEFDTLSADIYVRRGVLSATHTTMEGLAPAARYHLDRRRRGDRWSSVLTTTSPTRPPVVAPSGKDEDVPPTVVRVEDAGDGSALRFFTADGEIQRVDRLRQRLRGAEPLSMIPNAAELMADPWGAGGEAAPPASRGSEWIEGLMPSRSRSSQRRQALRQRWGSGGSLRGLDRFVIMSGAETTELLADPATGLIVEVNHVKGARLERHASMRYVDGPGGRLLRQSLRVERRLPHGDDLRDVTEVVVADVRTSGGR